jgi:putative transcriptional regulator
MMGSKDKMLSYRSEIAGAIHEMMSDAHEVGVVSNETLRSFDATCLPAAPALAAEEIRALREREHVSQPVFAAYLNVSRNLVSDWERGVKRPGGPALRLLSIVQRKGLQALA